MLKLLRLSETEFEDFSRRTVSDYAGNLVESEAKPHANAFLDAAELFQKILPNGQHTPNHYFFSIFAEAASHAVGNIWLQLNSEEDSAFLFDIHIEPVYRRRGYASRALSAAEEFVRKQGLSKISLHAFGHNGIAIALYQRAGFTLSHVTMSKDL